MTPWLRRVEGSPLRSNPIASWELRIDQFRVFYDVDAGAEVVLIKAVGWKEHNTLYFRGKVKA